MAEPQPADLPLDPRESQDWTPARLFLVGFLSVGALILGALLRSPPKLPVALRRHQAPLLSAHVALKKPLRLGASLRVEFVLKNASKRPLPVADRRSFPGAREEFEVELRDSQGQRVPEHVNAGSRSSDLSTAPALGLLLPGAEIALPVDLDRHLRLTVPGDYTLRITRHPFIDRIRVSAPTVSLHVDPAR